MLQAYFGAIGVNVELVGYDQMMAQQEQYNAEGFDILLKTHRIHRLHCKTSGSFAGCQRL